MIRAASTILAPPESDGFAKLQRKGSKREAMKRRRRFSPKGESLVRRMRPMTSPIETEDVVADLRRAATNIGYARDRGSSEYLAGWEHLTVTEAADTIERLREENARLREALDRVADVWTLQARVQPTDRKWHCQHEEWLSASVETARAALTPSADDDKELR